MTILTGESHTAPEVLYEDEDIAVINKPAGMVVNVAESVRGRTVQDWWMERVLAGQEVEQTTWLQQIPATFTEQYGTPTNIFVERGGIVHRLDKDTSGALLLAKHPGALLHLLSQFQRRTVHKRYLCLVHGQLAQPKGLIDFPIDRSQFNRHKFVVSHQGRPSQTEYLVEVGITRDTMIRGVEQLVTEMDLDWSSYRKDAEQLYQGCSLVSCWPKTGRTHQIRVHLTHLNHPLVADEVYAGRKKSRLDLLWCPRQFLHAAELSFIHPRRNEQLSIQAPLPAQLQHILDALKQS